MRKIDLKKGKIIYDEFHVDFSKPFSEQLDHLAEDLLQVEYPEDFLLDIGWYPEYEPEGQFIIQLVEGGNWDHPKYKKCCTKAEELCENVEEAINLANNLQ